ncbi:META domain-containing protein [Acinetobacter puyangensis]|uniref:META domain-containing protein n=1 Tax=Acinetobacter puyangensis TaxID=1096779 RepID=UPI003A4D9B00
MRLNSVFAQVFLIGMAVLMTACQSHSPTQSASKNKGSGQKATNTPLQLNTQSIPVIKSKDGIQDIKWMIKSVKSKKALYFNQMPSVLLQSNVQRVIGNTGCNSIYGSYQIDVSKKTIQFKTNAGHQSCDNALAQEAELMDAFARVQYFSVQNKRITFYDVNRQVLITAEI